MGTIGSLGISPSTLRIPQSPQIPQKKAQSDGLLCVTISYYEHNDIINKNIVTHRNLSELIATHNTHLPQAQQPNFLSEAVRCGTSQKKPSRDSTSYNITGCVFSIIRVGVQHSTKTPTMGSTWRTSHCRGFLVRGSNHPL